MVLIAGIAVAISKSVSSPISLVSSDPFAMVGSTAGGGSAKMGCNAPSGCGWRPQTACKQQCREQ
eukprot:5701973-Alexandrium_andersonii.AAC.1